MYFGSLKTEDYNKPRFLIWSLPYVHYHAGVKVLYRLCHLLNSIGESAFMYGTNSHPQWNTPLAADIRPNDIMIYPEVIPGNYFMAPHVVRWCLNVPGYFGTGDIQYDKDEMVWFYTDELLDKVNEACVEKVGVERKLMISTMDSSIYYNDNGPKTEIAYYIGKGKIPKNYELIEGAKVITREWPPTQIETADLYRRCHTLYSFDDFTAAIPEAITCGARVFVVNPDGSHTERTAIPVGFDQEDIERVKYFAAEVKKHFGVDTCTSPAS